MSAELCTACDLYWALGEEIAFVSVGTCQQTLADPLGQKVWKDPRVSVYVDPQDPMVRHHFSISTRRSPITMATIETVLTWLENWFYTSDREEEKLLSGQTISDVDIAP